MNRILKGVSVLGNAAQIVIAASIVADLIIRFRNRKKAPDTKPVEAEELPSLDSNLAPAA